MKAIIIQNFGHADNLTLGNWEKPSPKSNELLVRVEASALNRADILQRQGKYPPPKGASPILGLEIAGEVVRVGENCQKYKVGDKVFGLLSGGGYAEFAVISEAMALPIPKNWTVEEAVAIPEVFLTAYQALHWSANIKKHERILIHAGGSGVGTALIQLSQLLENEIFITASEAKHEKCQALGAKHCIDYKTESFQEVIRQKTDKKGVHVIVDFLGASYFMDNLKSLAVDGRLVMLALMGGIKVSEVNVAYFLTKRLQVIGSTLRSRSADYQEKLTMEFWNYAEEKFKSGQLKPVIDSVWSWEKIAEAHRYMEANQNFGKIVLRID